MSGWSSSLVRQPPPAAASGYLVRECGKISPLIRRLVLVALGIFVLYVGPGYYVTGRIGIALLVVVTVAVLIAIDRYATAHAGSPRMSYRASERLLNGLRVLMVGGVGLLILLGDYPASSRWLAVFLALAYAGYSAYRIWHPHRLSTGDVELDKIDDLAQRDPEAAEAAYEKLFASREKQEEEELTRLRAAAKNDVQAAKQLRDRLRKQLTPPSVIRQYKKQLANEPGISVFLETVEERDAATRLEIADLETRIKLLS